MTKRETQPGTCSLFRLVGPLIGLTLLLLACGPAETSTRPSDGGSGRASTGLKNLNIALQEEPVSIVLYGRPGEGGTTSARFERYFTFHSNLTFFDAQRNVLPHAAAKVPALEDGDWKVNPDSTMEVTWKIRPDAYWHDGKPLTADDFAFGFEVVRDPRLAVATLGEIVNMASVKAIDPKTFVVSWKILSVNGNTNATEGVPAIPKHQLEDLYRSGDAVALEASAGWREEFVGLGPYKLSRWEPGGFLEAQAFDLYYLGKPKIDRLTFRWVPDINVLTANVLAGTVDLVPPGTTIKPEQMVEIRRQWGDGGTVGASPNDIRSLTINHREERPWSQDVRFRQAMLYSLNRQQLVDVLQYGFVEMAPYFAFPEEPLYRLAEQRRLQKYDYDPRKAVELFAAAGWTKGADGLLHSSSGQVIPPFPCCRYPSADSNDIRESLAWGNDWRDMGMDVQHPLTPAPAGLSSTETRKWQAQSGWGGSVGNYRVTADQNFATLVKANIGTEATRWSGVNGGAWTNPRFEDTFARAMSTLNAAQRLEIEYQLFQIMMDELPMLPAYYNPLGLVIRKGVVGLGKNIPVNRAITVNLHEWDIRNS